MFSLTIAQSLSILPEAAESGIKIIALYRDFAPGFDPPRSEPEAESLLLKKSLFQLKKNNASRLLQERCDLKDWPVIYG